MQGQSWIRRAYRMNANKHNIIAQEQIKEFKEQGYCLYKGLLERNKAEAAANWLKWQNQAKLAKSWTEKEPGVPLAVYTVVHQDDNPLAVLICEAQVLNVATQLIAEPVYIWASKVNIKAAWCGTAEYYHQDYVYWKDRGYIKDRMLSCMIFLEPHNIYNAALHVMPGTHKLGFIPHMPFININGLSKNMVPPETLDRLYKVHGMEVIEAEPGDVLFFHTLLVHGSSHNISQQGRMVLIAQLNALSNKPSAVTENARLFNLRRAELEMQEAEHRYKWFKNKYESQFASEELTFSAPIPTEEKV